MSRPTAWWIHLSVLGMGLTGLSLAWMVLLMTPEATAADEFSVVSHPLEPWSRAVHVVVGPMLVFGIGLIWRAHVWARFRDGRRKRRRTGLVLALLAPLLVASGYSLLVIESETAREWIAYVHASSGVGFVLTYLIHQLLRDNGNGNATSSPESRRRSRSDP